MAYTMVMENMDKEERDNFNESLLYTRQEYVAELARKATEAKINRASNIERLGGVIQK